MPKTLTEQYQLWMEAGATYSDVENRMEFDRKMLNLRADDEIARASAAMKRAKKTGEPYKSPVSPGYGEEYKKRREILRRRSEEFGKSPREAARAARKKLGLPTK